MRVRDWLSWSRTLRPPYSVSSLVSQSLAPAAQNAPGVPLSLGDQSVELSTAGRRLVTDTGADPGARGWRKAARGRPPAGGARPDDSVKLDAHKYEPPLMTRLGDWPALNARSCKSGPLGLVAFSRG